ALSRRSSSTSRPRDETRAQTRQAKSHRNRLGDPRNDHRFDACMRMLALERRAATQTLSSGRATRTHPDRRGVAPARTGADDRGARLDALSSRGAPFGYARLAPTRWLVTRDRLYAAPDLTRAQHAARFPRANLSMDGPP